MKEYQTTIKSPFSLAGAGLHTGKYTNTTILPAEAAWHEDRQCYR